MALTDQQKQALKARKNPAPLSAMTPEQEAEIAEQAEQDVSRETLSTLVAASSEVPPEHVAEAMKNAFGDSDPLDAVGKAHADMHLRDEDVLFDEAEQNGEVIPYLAPTSNSVTILEGVQVYDDMTDEQKEIVAENIFSYAGVIPKPIDGYTNRWIKCLGAALMPIEHDTGDVQIDHETGETKAIIKRWVAPLLKIDAIDDLTGMHVILSGGGKYGKLFARQMAGLFGAGDWQKPREIFISQEARSGINKETGKPEPHRMYRFLYRRIAK